MPPALEAWSLKHWATREVPTAFIYIYDPIFAYDVGLAFMKKKKYDVMGQESSHHYQGND